MFTTMKRMPEAAMPHSNTRLPINSTLTYNLHHAYRQRRFYTIYTNPVVLFFGPAHNKDCSVHRAFGLGLPKIQPIPH